MNWFTGYGSYHTTLHCLGSDYPWALAVTTLCGVIVCAYAVIAYTWWRAASQAPDSTNKRLLNQLLWVFVLCAICGYASRIVAWWWPGYRLLAGVLVALAVVSWSFAWSARGRWGVVFRTLQQAEFDSRYEAAWANAAAGMARVDLEGRVLELNRCFASMLGLKDRHALDGQTFASFTHPLDTAEDLRRFHALIQGRIHRYVLAKRWLRKDGSVLHGNLSVSLARAADGSPLYAVGVVVDTTELVDLLAARDAQLEALHRMRDLSASDTSGTRIQALLERALEHLEGDGNA